MSNVSADFKEQISAELKDQPKLQREPTKLECGLLGALCATVVLAVLFWLGFQFSILQLMIQIR
jgi:hypothetical protein